MKNSYDAIVVGAGPAGSAAALTMAQNGLSVALLERGESPGSKTMFGGSIYSEPTQEIVPSFWEEAPIERTLVTDLLYLMDHDSAVQVGFTGLRFNKAPYNKFSVSRVKFDAWLANKAVQAGADLHSGAVVRDLVYEKGLLTKGPVKGVSLDAGEIIEGNIVILAEGVNAFLTKKAGLRTEIPTSALTLYVKEVLALPAEKLEDRFQLEPGEGTVIGFVGWPLAGSVGKSGIWIQKDSISIVTGTFLNQMTSKGLDPCILMERFKSHPLIKRMIKGAEPVEFQGQLIPKGGAELIPKLYADGLMVVGDAAVMISGRRGTDLAMLSGKYAGETAMIAKARGDYSEDILKNYQLRLDNSFFMKDIKANKGMLEYNENYQDADLLLSTTANEVAYKFFQEETITGKEKMKEIIERVTNKQLPFKTVDDVIMGIKYWGFF